ncbi:MAG: ABC-2 transporter permease [Tissierellia bacterium]|nr:ABC-2 transporter permease [Tissierellia bacterium]
MLGTLKRDLLLMVSSKQVIILWLFYIPLLIFVVDSFVPEVLYYMIIVFYTYLASITSFSYDITGKSKYIMNSLPISRREVVLYRYLSTFIYFAITIVYAGIYLWIINALKLAHVDYFNLRAIVNAIPAVMISTSLVYPAFFRFEPRIARIVHMVVFMTFFVGLSNISMTGEKGILKYVSLLKWEHVMIIALVMYILSLILSMQIYKNRDI